MSKSVTLSVRLSEEDATFIASQQIEGAVTPSDKLRAIIREARVRAQEANSYSDLLAASSAALQPVMQAVLAQEKFQAAHSELVTRALPWLAEVYAYARSALAAGQITEKDLKALEQGLAERLFRQFEWLARMGVTRTAPCYDPGIITRYLETQAELLKLLAGRSKEDPR